MIFEAWRVCLVLPLLDHAVLDQSLQPRRKDVARDAEVLLDLVEAVRAQKELAQQEHTPCVAKDVERSGNRAGGGISWLAPTASRWTGRIERILLRTPMKLVV